MSSFVSAASRSGKQYRRRETEDSSSDDEEDSAAGDGFSTFVIFDDRSYFEELRDIQLQFDRQGSFIVAGLRSVGRVAQQDTGWEFLAERLDWKKRSSVG